MDSLSSVGSYLCRADSHLSPSLLHWSVSFLFDHLLISTFTHKYGSSVALGAYTDNKQVRVRSNCPEYLLNQIRSGSLSFLVGHISFLSSWSKHWMFPSHFRGRLPNSELRRPTTRNWLIIWRTANITRWSRAKTRRRRSDLQPIRPNMRLSLRL